MAQPDVSLCRAGTETDQVQKRQRLELVLAVTLPFKRQDVSQNLFGLAIDQTRKRWAWFTKSRELESGTELGTLVYLPWEIRQQIFKEVLPGLCDDTQRYHHGCLGRYTWNGGRESEALHYAEQALPSTERAHDIFDLAS